MKGLTLTQPYASLVAGGVKTIETRSWSTTYRGELLIHAAQGFPANCQALVHRDPFAEALIGLGYDRSEKLPRGVVVALAILEACIPTDQLDPFWVAAERRAGFGWIAREQAFGNYSERRFAWVLRDVRPLREALPVKGALGLWSVPQTLLDLLAGQGVV